MDKNLGPAILEHSKYINRTLFEDHLEDPQTYKQLPEPKATAAIAIY